MSDYYTEKVEQALSRERLDELKPSTEEMFENTRRGRVWYNEAVWTAAAIFVEAAQESKKFRRSFVAADSQSASETWRTTMQEEVPELHERVMGIGLSAFQGGNAEQVARSILEGE